MLLLAATNIYILFFHRKKMAIKLQEIQRLELEKKLLVFKSASEAEERERERIARNLHDEINLMLAVHKQILEKHGFEIESNVKLLNTAKTKQRSELELYEVFRGDMNTRVNYFSKMKGRFKHFMEKSCGKFVRTIHIRKILIQSF